MSRLHRPAIVTVVTAWLLLGAGAIRSQDAGESVAPARAPVAPAPSGARPTAPEAAEPGDDGRSADTDEPDDIEADVEEEFEALDADDAPAASEPGVLPPHATTVGDGGDATSPAPGGQSAMTRGPKKQVYGWIEDVLIDPRHALKLPAKLDTGADTTSLDARNIRRSRRDGEDYVRFVVTEPETGQSVELEKPFVRAVRIKGHGTEDVRRRVVVRMRICIGDRSRSIEVNLVDRGRFEYPLLLGRNALRDVAVIDPNLRRTREPSCWTAADSWAAAPPSDNTESESTEPAGGATPVCESAPMC
jgi:hypothetical protein